MTERTPIHPLLAVAAAAVIVASGFGVAKMMNWLPASSPAQAAADQAKTDADAKAQADAQAKQQADAQAQLAADAQNKALADRQAAAAAAAAHRQAVAARRAEARAQRVSEQSNNGGSTQYASGCDNCGVITAITPVTKEGSGSGLGAVAGAVLGGVLGHQVGHGKGNTLATVAGALGGAFGGNVVEDHVRSTTNYVISVRLQDGHSETFTYDTPPNAHVGDQVRVEGEQLVPR